MDSLKTILIILIIITELNLIILLSRSCFLYYSVAQEKQLFFRKLLRQKYHVSDAKTAKAHKLTWKAWWSFSLETTNITQLLCVSAFGKSNVKLFRTHAKSAPRTTFTRNFQRRATGKLARKLRWWKHRVAFHSFGWRRRRLVAARMIIANNNLGRTEVTDCKN